MMQEAKLILYSTIGFLCLRYLVKLICNERYLQKNHVSKCWIWKNTLVSFVHSIIASAWTVYCFHDNNDLLYDLIHASSSTSRSLLAFSIGYFIYDVIDIVIYDRFQQWFYICHHFASIIALSLALSTDKLMGMGVWGLVMEWHSIFLHLRQLMKLSNNTNNFKYKINTILNTVTVVALRIIPSFWMAVCLWNYGNEIAYYQYCWSVMCLSLLKLNNFTLGHYFVWKVYRN